jgi:photosystem II stability/assembly factor-like uncharacterized protein
MKQDFTIFVGAEGEFKLWRSPDGGGSWESFSQKLEGPFPTLNAVRALAVYPDNAHRILAGCDGGIYRSEDNGDSWTKLDSPFDGMEVWSIGIDHVDTDTIFVGTRPDAYRSKDGGLHWEKLDIGVDLDCPIGLPRTTNVIVDPRDHRTIWAGAEVDGVFKSLDGGDSWLRLPDLGPDPFHGDIHGMTIRPVAPTAVYATSPFGVATSTDEGESWDYHLFPKFHEDDRRSYCRGALLKADDPDVMFVGNGDTVPGQTGAIQRSRDGGQTWEKVPLPVEPNSVVYWFATHPAIPNVIAAISLFGYLYLSTDGGESWEKLKKEFGETRTVAVTPN